MRHFLDQSWHQSIKGLRVIHAGITPRFAQHRVQSPHHRPKFVGQMGRHLSLQHPASVTHYPPTANTRCQLSTFSAPSHAVSSSGRLIASTASTQPMLQDVQPFQCHLCVRDSQSHWRDGAFGIFVPVACQSRPPLKPVFLFLEELVASLRVQAFPQPHVGYEQLSVCRDGLLAAEDVQLHLAGVEMLKLLGEVIFSALHSRFPALWDHNSALSARPEIGRPASGESNNRHGRQQPGGSCTPAHASSLYALGADQHTETRTPDARLPCARATNSRSRQHRLPLPLVLGLCSRPRRASANDCRLRLGGGAVQRRCHGGREPRSGTAERANHKQE